MAFLGRAETLEQGISQKYSRNNVVEKCRGLNN